MKIVIAPGAFKNSLTAAAVADAVARGLRRSGLNADLHLLPIADGGNGTLAAFLSQGGQRHTVKVLDPLGRPVEADFGTLGDTAVIEMALASGLELLQTHEYDPLQTTTYGTGQLMQAALETGVKRVIVGMGGSATVDGGAGALQALGVRLLDGDGAAVSHGGGNLSRIATIDTSHLDSRWQSVEVLIASDVDNPTLGAKGAAAVFAPQKGASVGDVRTLEDNLHYFFTMVRGYIGVEVREAKSGGAAGALAAGLMAFLNAKAQSGINLVLEHTGFESLLEDAALVVTGEGRMDAQTIDGKGPVGVARRAKAQGVPTVALVGGLEVDDAVLHEAGIDAVLPVVDRPMALEDALEEADALVERAALRLGYLLQMGRM